MQEPEKDELELWQNTGMERQMDSEVNRYTKAEKADLFHFGFLSSNSLHLDRGMKMGDGSKQTETDDRGKSVTPWKV